MRFTKNIGVHRLAQADRLTPTDSLRARTLTSRPTVTAPLSLLTAQNDVLL